MLLDGSERTGGSARFTVFSVRMDVGRLAGRLALSTGQALTRHGKSDDEAFRLPLSRDLSSELSGHGRPHKKLAESVIAEGEVTGGPPSSVQLMTTVPERAAQ
jgi:hypothetical protein